MTRITIETVVPAKDESRYDSHRQEYQQTVESLDLAAVIAVVNGLNKQDV
jgi:hypothetical protein